MVDATSDTMDALKKLDTLDTNEGGDAKENDFLKWVGSSFNNSTLSSSADGDSDEAENPADFTEEELKKAEEYKT